MNENIKDAWMMTAVIVVLIAVCFGGIALGFVGCGAAKNFSRSQRLKTARNNVKVTEINVAKARQRARITTAEIAITKARAQMRYQESIGIRKAQDEISSTLTPLYIQHEAIQAMERGGASKIYIPSGAQGIPLVNNVSGDPPGK